MNQIQNGFGSLELGIWILFVICYLVLEICSIQGLNYTEYIQYDFFKIFIRNDPRCQAATTPDTASVPV